MCINNTIKGSHSLQCVQKIKLKVTLVTLTQAKTLKKIFFSFFLHFHALVLLGSLPQVAQSVYSVYYIIMPAARGRINQRRQKDQRSYLTRPLLCYKTLQYSREKKCLSFKRCIWLGLTAWDMKRNVKSCYLTVRFRTLHLCLELGLPSK